MTGVHTFPTQKRADGRLKIAVIGSGITGSSAAWALHKVHDVVLYEKEQRPGGHTATVDIDYNGTPISVDTGFIVYNEATYPNLTALFNELDVKTHESNMSFSLSLDQGKLEWSGDSLWTIFAQKRNLFRPSFLLMIREILRFNKQCLVDRAGGHLADISIGDYLNWRGFSPGFMNNYLVPMAAAIWSTEAKRMMQFPADYFVNFFDNHRLIYSRAHMWRTVTGGSRNYLDKLLAPVKNARIGHEVTSVRRSGSSVFVTDSTGRTEEYDRVILASHSDQTLKILSDATEQEKRLLHSIPYQANRVILHRDQALMPVRKRVWASWNYLRNSKTENDKRVAVSYWMNRLQGIDNKYPLFVTLNPEREPDPKLVFAEFSYDHPQFSGQSMLAQKELETIQGENNTWFAGAWTGYGFHEDGLSSGLAAAEALGGIIPWRKGKTAFAEAAE